MMDQKYILAIDQGTSSTKSIIFDQSGNPVAKGHVDLNTQFIDGGLVEQDPFEIYQNVLASVKNCLDDYQSKGLNIIDVVSVGISNQRETFVVWDETGKPLHNAVVWQCKRSVAVCERLKSEGLNDEVKQRTGLIIDPYFSATKLIWLYENNLNIHTAIDEGRAYFGTVDTWLLFKLSKGTRYLTDHTNASRTMFFNLKTLQWDKYLLDAFNLSKLNLPEVCSSSFNFGSSDFEGLFKVEIPINTMIGDSHAAAFGEQCFEKGQAKATLGTGCSILMNAGADVPDGGEGVITTICWSTTSLINYALEGVIVSCGSTIEWLRRELGLFSEVMQTQDMARAVPDNNGVYIIPAFSGLGAPYWDMNRKAEIQGLTFSCNKNHIVRAGLESVAYQIRAVIDVMKDAGQLDLQGLIVNGGIINNQFVLECLTNLLNRPLTYGITDASGLGAAYLAGLQAGIFKDLNDIIRIAKHRSTMMPVSELKIEKNYRTWEMYVKLGSSRQIVSTT
ncbi:MAG: glycerol kinase GlpK [Mucilaginibacter sp.]|uniref:FGGY family carbohydrate kinase n=1 Tax=Mucilaginibacter sp. TaxID=1882438 RepID=UPI003266A689